MMVGIIHTKEEFIEKAANWIISQIEKNGARKIALSGGKTPVPIYKALGEKFQQKSFNGIEFFEVDERYVSVENSESNYKIITENLKQPVHHFDTTIPIEKALEKYKEELPKDNFDLIILGIGPDGHIASLFPHTAALNTNEPVAHTQTDEFAVHDRLTLTFTEIMKAKNLLVLLNGKPEILKELQHPSKTTEEFPANKLLEHRNLTVLSLE